MRKLRPWTQMALLAFIVLIPTARAASDLRVTVELTGLDDNGLHKEMQALSTLSKGTESYTALAAIRREVDRETQSILKALQSKGYYAAEITPEIQRTGLDVAVTYRATPGEKFDITEYQIRYVDTLTPPRPSSFEEIGQSPDGNPDGQSLKFLGTMLVSWLWNNGFPSAEEMSTHVEAHFANTEAIAVYEIRSGPLSYYGQIRVTGNERTEESFVEANFRPARGDVYRVEEIDTFRSRLSATNLFRQISIQPAPPTADGTTDLLVTLEERKHRTIGAGISFGTDVGVGATATWENRNILGGGERLTTELSWSSPAQDLEIIFEDPLPRLPGSWNSSLLLENETTDAYEAQTVTIGAGVKKTFFENKWQLNAGLNYTYSTITDFSDADFPDGVDETYQTASFPSAATYSNENDTLNPTSGYRLKVEVTPYFGDIQFNRAELSGASRIGFGKNKKLLLASRARIGATIGASGDDLPATERFFSGGGGSVRGYAYQEAGPIDDETGNPTGGASVAELNFETRYQLSEKIQFALFADGGSVYESETPDFSGDFLVGAGMGVRYMTPIGPIRLDVATPIDKREIRGLRKNEDGILEDQAIFQDDPVQIYIALGQPF